MNVTARELHDAIERARSVVPHDHAVVADGETVAGLAGALGSVRTPLALPVDGDPIAFHPEAILRWLKRRDDDAKVAIEYEDGQLTLKSGRAKIAVRCLINYEPPAWPVVDGEPLAIDELWDAIEGCAHAASHDDTRPLLTGTCLGPFGVAVTDSYRLAHHRLDGPGETVLIPAATLALVAKHADGAPTVTTGAGAAHIDDGTSEWVVRLIDGDYPNWQALVGEPPNRMSFARDEIEAAVADCKGTESGIVRIDVDGSEATVSARETDSHDTATVIDVETEPPAKIRIGFNVAYLADALKGSGDSEQVTIRYTDELKPVHVEGDDSDHLELLMPVRINDGAS